MSFSCSHLSAKVSKQRIDQIMLQQDIVAIVGTLKLDYQNIPFIPAADLFERDKILEFPKTSRH